MRAGLTLAIVGRPNVGKSSLFNRLLEQDRAIVTDIPGTTRDVVSEVAAIHGIPVKLFDTAGIREGEGLVETLGIERSFQAMADADLTLVVVDLSAPRRRAGSRVDGARARAGPLDLLVGNKCDLPRGAELIESMLPVSALTGEGIEALRDAVFQAVAPAGGGGAGDRLHHQPAPRAAAARIAGVSGRRRPSAAAMSIPHEMLLLDLYGALRPIDAITGATTADDILNRIFSTFCIGK